ncbi:MAG: hypothetical protein ACXW31_15040 [Thermoanaerobaculia bacterium]
MILLDTSGIISALFPINTDMQKDLRIGLADASIVLWAERFDITDVVTLDERHFRAIRIGRRRRLRLLPTEM